MEYWLVKFIFFASICITVLYSQKLCANSFVIVKGTRSLSGKAKSQSEFSINTLGVSIQGFLGYPVSKYDKAGISIAFDINDVKLNFDHSNKSGIWTHLQLGGGYSLGVSNSISLFSSAFLVLIGNMETQSSSTTIVNGEEFKHSSITTYSGTTSFGLSFSLNAVYEGLLPFGKGALFALGLDYINQAFNRASIQSVSTDEGAQTEEESFELTMNIIRFNLSVGLSF